MVAVVDGQVTVFESEKSKQLTKLLENGLDMYYKTPEYQLAACQALEQVSARHDHPSGKLRVDVHSQRLSLPGTLVIHVVRLGWGGGGYIWPRICENVP